MPYVLGIDVGRTRGAAAVCRRVGAGYGPAEVVPIDHGSRWTPAVLTISDTGELLVGQAAQAWTAVEPQRVARGFLPRVGDGIPVLLGGELYPAETLAAAVVTWIADAVAAAEGEAAERIAVTHPPDWGSYRRGLFRGALHAAGMAGVLLLPTVVAAAEAAHERSAVPVGSALALTLIGGRHVEHAVLHRAQASFELANHRPMIDADAGDHLDDVLASLVRPGTDRLACAQAKELLSTAPEVRLQDDVVTRAAFDEVARPALAAVVDDLARLAAGVPADVQAGVVLAGGTAAVPLVATLAAARFDGQVTVETDPATAPARGAALAACPRLAPARFAAPGANLSADASHPGFRHATPATGIAHPGGGALVALEGRGAEIEEGVGVREGVDLPPPRPPVEISPLDPPPRRFNLRPRRPGDQS
ncbi:Hsp70 family protein [Actinokineospora sp. HUAS TT18]|uniref:Hsp70 family protein n=1 Tax=Actinokineospora sp. HUAS TT18 TaxID=3447451 RepID=UPI003F526855